MAVAAAEGKSSNNCCPYLFTHYFLSCGCHTSFSPFHFETLPRQESSTAVQSCSCNKHGNCTYLMDIHLLLGSEEANVQIY